MLITVKFSSLFKALSRVDQDIVDVSEGTTIDQLANVLGRKYKNLPFDSELTFFIVNDKISARDHILVEGDNVRILQSLAGG